MVEPTGYTALDLIGFTDKGTYNPATNYVKNDLVHYGGSIWRVLIDDTIGIAPTEGLYYTFFVGEPTNLVERIMAPLEQNPATQNWTVGRQIINNDYLYEVIAPIAIGDNLVAYEDDPVNANIKLAPPIETQVLAIKNEADKTEDMIAPSETNPAGSSHSVGTQIIVDNILYDVTSPIAANDALVAYPTAGYNIKPAVPVSSQIEALTNDKQNKTMSSAVTIDGTSKTTVESAISGIAPVVDKVAKSANEYKTDGTSYKKGDYCTHDGKLYRCTNNCSGAWDSNCWDEDTLTNAVNQLNSPFNILSNSTYGNSQSKGILATSSTEVTDTMTLARDSIVFGIAGGANNHHIYYGNPTPNQVLVYPGLSQMAFSVKVLAAGTVLRLSASGNTSTAYVTAIPLESFFKTLH